MFAVKQSGLKIFTFWTIIKKTQVKILTTFYKSFCYIKINKIKFKKFDLVWPDLDNKSETSLY